MELTPTQWEQLKTLFEAALQQDSASRPSFLEHRCPNLEIRRQAERLLADYQEMGNFIGSPAWANLTQRPQPVETTNFTAGEIIAERFGIVRFIARGGMGEVYEAEDLELNARVAVKAIRPDLLRPLFLEQFKKEVQLAKQVTHPNVCRIYDLFRHPTASGTLFFVAMELLSGDTLADRLRRAPHMEVGEIRQIVVQVAGALDAAHAVGILHRDLKPENIMLVRARKQGSLRAVVADFGLALQSVAGMSIVAPDTVAGTPAYMSPEQLLGDQLSPASDIYSLGLVMYRMVTGVRAFENGEPTRIGLRRLMEAPKRPSELVPDLDGRWETVILKCLEREPSRRYQTARQVQREVQALGADPNRVEHHLSKVLASRSLENSPHSRKLLEFVVRKKLVGEEEFLNETVIAVEVFEKSTDFDATLDTTVRSGANRLRAKLKEYYESEGQGDTFKIELPEGHFVPRLISKPAIQARVAPSEWSKVAVRERLRFPHFLVWTSAVALVLCITGYLLRQSKRGETSANVALAQYPDREVSPTFSPDGEQIAYHSSGGIRPNNNIYRRPSGGGQSVQLTTGLDDDRNPAWSPDGRLIAFIRNSGPHGGVYLMDPDGRHSRRLTDTKGWAIGWFPNSRYLAIMDRASGDGPYGMFLVEAATGERHTLVPPSINPDGDHVIEFSPDGRRVAFVNNNQVWTMDIDKSVLPIAAGPMRSLTQGNREFYGLTWMPNSREILFSADRESGPHLWLVSSTKDSKPTPLQLGSVPVLRPVLSNSVKDTPLKLAYESFVPRVNLWRLNLSAERRVIGKPVRFLSSKHIDGAPQFSPNGKKVIFVSNRTGTWKIYMVQADGSAAVLLALPETSGSPRWSPDGLRIAFDSLVNNSREIYLMDIAKTELRRLTFAPCMEERPSWSKDGKWIYFASDCSKKVFFEIWKIRSDGAGGMRQVTFHGGYEAFESWDGMSLYYVKSLDAPGLWKVSPDGGDENPILDSVTEGAWSMAEDGIYFFNFGTSERSRSLQFYSFANSRTELIYQTHADATRHSPGLAARRDGRSILVALLENQNSEINVVDPFELLGSRRDSIP